MTVIISDEILQSARLTEAELKQELAIMLFHQDRLTLGQASRLANMGRIEFQRLLAGRKIPLHYGVEDLDADLTSLKSLGRL